MKKREGLKVLLIEDTLSHAERIKRELRNIGSAPGDVVHVTTGERGLEALQGGDFDLVLLDYSLPTIDGLEVLKRMRKMELDVPVVMITGHDSERVAAEAMRLGAHDSISEFDLLRPRQAAALLGVTYQTIKNYIHSGMLKAYKTPGGHHRIRRGDIIKLGFLKDGPPKEGSVEDNHELYQVYINIIGALTEALDSRDGVASGHSRRVASYVAILADNMGISGKEQKEIELAALLHDVGKVLISEQILSKPGRLTDQDHYVMRQHPEMGERILNQVEFLKGTKLHIRHHHEQFDGRGHPDGLSGEGIPLGARMIAVAEAFDCITSDCTFQPKRSIEDAINEIQKHAGTQFDPRIVGIFMDKVVSKLHDGDLDQLQGNHPFREVGRD